MTELQTPARDPDDAAARDELTNGTEPATATDDDPGWADEAARHAPDARRTSTITTCADLAALEAAIRQVCEARGLPLAAQSVPA